MEKPDSEFIGKVLGCNFRLIDIGDFTHLSLSAHDGFILSRIEGEVDGHQLLVLTGLPQQQLIESLARMVSYGLLTSGDIKIDFDLKLIKDEHKLQSMSEKAGSEAKCDSTHEFAFVPPEDNNEDDDTADFFAPPDDEEPETVAEEAGEGKSEPSTVAVTAENQSDESVTTAPSPAVEKKRKKKKRVSIDLESIPDWSVPPVQGNLKSNSFAKMIDFIIRTGQTGILSIEREGVHKRIYFLAGRLLNVESISIIEEECLGQILKQFGKITDEELEQSRQRMEAEGRKQGDILVEMGLITPNLLIGSLKKQVEIKFCEIYEWEDGLYSFEKRCDFSYHDFDFTLGSINYKMAKEHTHSDDARLELEPYLDRFIYSNNDDSFYIRAELSLNKKEKKYLKELNGTRTLRNSFAYSPVSKVATYRMLYGFYLARLIEFKESKSHEEQQAKLEAEFERELLYVKTKDYFDVLEAHWSARPYEIEASYERLKKQYSISNAEKKATPRLLNLSREILEYIEQAYSILRDETKRVHYRKENIGEFRLKVSAELQFKKGENFLFWKEEYGAALYHLESAVDLAPRNSDYLATLALATFIKFNKSEPTKAREAFGLIERAHRMSKNNPVVFFCQGMMLFHSGKRGQAVEKLQLALKLDPNYIEAKRAMRMIAAS
jgi:tetratricopeptide (TPR) repeat protein